MKQKMRKILLNSVASISPSTYKNRVFKHHNNMSFRNLDQVKLKAEPLLLEFLLEKNYVLFDVGAHIGEYILFGNKSVPMNQIYAFEPNDGQYRLLKKTFRKAKIYNIALSNENGIKQFKVPVLKGKQQTTRGTLKVNIQEKDEESKVIFEVKVKTLDTFVEDQKIDNLGLIKIDVEGAELDVIEGATKTIARMHPTLILELEKRHLGGSIVNAIEKVNGLGYKCFYYNPDKMEITEVPADADDVQDEQFHKVNPVRYINNFIFIEDNEQLVDKIKAINLKIKSKDS